MTSSIEPAESDLVGPATHLLATQKAARRLVSISGHPSSGKSTFADRLKSELNKASPGIYVLLPMDGFHFDDAALRRRGDLPRKGAPHTFDVDGLAAILDRLSADDGREIAIPVFDRSIELSRAGAEIFSLAARIVLVEGNHLLLDDLPWRGLEPRFGVTVFLEVPRSLLAERLSKRWERYGFSPSEINAKLDDNDLPNADIVVGRSNKARFPILNH